ncbi:MAG TPA: hypothetical protein VGR02_16995 [Thermoanaerobaculia bacterium]|jgi:hypothetical protein|nr:hypothetical protein [Thermoanaerobaculia bacterium]
MKQLLLTLALLAAASASAQTSPAARVADDAKVIDRVAQAAKKDLPTELLRRIVNEDVDLLRGKRGDGTYQYAGFERLEASRSNESFSVAAKKGEELATLTVRGEFAYRLIVDSPSRRMLVTKNRHIWIDRIDVEYIPLGDKTTKVHSVKVESWLEPGDAKPFDFPDIARQVTARVYVRGDSDKGYGNVDLTLVAAKVFDDPASPYADAVSSAKAIQRALDRGDIPSIRSMASRIAQTLQPAAAATSAVPTVAARTIEVTAPKGEDEQTYRDLQAIEDLLTGTDAEKREGLDRLHQLVRRLRPRS